MSGAVADRLALTNQSNDASVRAHVGSFLDWKVFGAKLCVVFVDGFKKTLNKPVTPGCCKISLGISDFQPAYHRDT